MATKLRVKGYPATFATAREKAWKESLARQIPLPNTDGQEKGVFARFYLETLAPQGQPLDVDNLMEPLLSVLVNKRRWFGGSRTEVNWWRATKSESERIGCDVEISELDRPPELIHSDATTVIDSTFEGNLPRNATNDYFADWADKHASPLRRGWGHYDVELTFRSPRVNIGEIATGVVKGTIDCLWPAFGGTVGRPQDWRIRTLQVVREKLSSHVESVAVRVATT